MCHPCNGETPADALPWERNRFRIGYGAINQQFGWICTLPIMPEFIFLDSNKGMCECYTEKENNNGK